MIFAVVATVVVVLYPYHLIGAGIAATVLYYKWHCPPPQGKGEPPVNPEVSPLYLFSFMRNQTGDFRGCARSEEMVRSIFENLKKKESLTLLNVDHVVQGTMLCPHREYKQLKMLSKDSLRKATEFMEKGEVALANKSFAFSYQMRVVADCVWGEILGNPSDGGHSKFLALQREFGRVTGKNKDTLSSPERNRILKALRKL